jgi:DNA-binding NarL/FixJ family response regulator
MACAADAGPRGVRYTGITVEQLIEIMVVDDEPDIRFMLRMYIGGLPGFDVTREAGNGAEALALIQVHCPDAVLLDIGMPVMDGLEATWQIRDVCPNTKIVIFSAYTADQVVSEALARGADLYLVKNTPPKEIAAAIERLCRAA